MKQAARVVGMSLFHVLRGEGFACGTKPGEFAEEREAHHVPKLDRCMRAGCTNAFAKADREARVQQMAASIKQGPVKEFNSCFLHGDHDGDECPQCAREEESSR